MKVDSVQGTDTEVGYLFSELLLYPLQDRVLVGICASIVREIEGKGRREQRTVWVVFRRDLKQRRECLLVLVDRWPDLLGNLHVSSQRHRCA